MDFQDYLTTARRFWRVLAAAVVVALVGAVAYNLVTFLDEAMASVAVVSPLQSSKANASAEAQVSFDAIIKSQTLADRVAARMGESGKTVHDDLSVTIDTGSGASSSATILTSPLYIVHGKDRGQARAQTLVTVAIQEATLLYFKINATDGSDLKAAIAVQRSALVSDVTTAEDALAKYSADNNAVDLPDRVVSQRARVDTLAQGVYAANSLAQGDRSSGSSNYSFDYARFYNLSSQLNTENAELNRLTSLLPTYNNLQFDVTVAQNKLQTFETENQSLLVNSLLPAQLQVKVLDAATPESPVLYLLLVYGLALVSGLIVGLGAIYVLGIIYKSPPSAEEVADAVRAPVLVRIPRVAG